MRPHLDAIVRLGIEQVEGDPFAARRGRVEPDRAGDEREAEIAFPGRTRRHAFLPLPRAIIGGALRLDCDTLTTPHRAAWRHGSRDIPAQLPPPPACLAGIRAAKPNPRLRLP